MTSQQVQWFLALAEHLNFTDAARCLYISQPALSRQISALEQELECKLFIRSNKEVSLTPSGEILLRHFKEWNRAFELSASEARFSELMENDRLRVGLISNLDVDGLWDAFARIQLDGRNNKLFMRRMPYPELILAFAKGNLDMVITLEDIREEMDNIETVELFEAGCQLVLARSHYMAKKDWLEAQDISHLAIISQDSSVATPKFDHLSKSFGYGAVPKRFVNAANAEEVMDFVAACSGAAIMGMPGNVDEEKFRVYPLEIRRKVVMAWKTGFRTPILDEVLERMGLRGAGAEKESPKV